MNSYTHNQTTPSAEWLITHNLNAHPVSDVMVDLDGKRLKIIPQALEYADQNTVLVRFSMPVTGTVRLVGTPTYALNPVEPEVPVDPEPPVDPEEPPVDPEEPPANNILFRETFDGTAGTTLAGRSPAVGPAWGTVTGLPSPIRYIYEDGAANLGLFHLDGVGGMWYGSSTDEGTEMPVPMAVPGNGYFEMKFTFTDPGVDGLYTFYFGGALDVPIINGVPDEENWGMNTPDISLRFSRDQGLLHSYFGSAENPTNGNDVPVGLAIIYGTEYTWRWDITAASFKVTLSDGTNTVTVVEDTGYAALPHWPNVQYGLGNFGPGFNFESYRGATAGYTTIGGAPAKITEIEIGTL